MQNKLLVSLTCALVVCINSAEARRMNPDLIKPQIPTANQQADSPQATPPPESVMCKDCNALNPISSKPMPSKPLPQAARVWEPEVRDTATWARLSKLQRSSEYSKFVIDVKTNKIYFIDSHVFTLHADFVVDYLLKIPRTTENMRAYNQNYSAVKPQFILGYLTHYPNINGPDLWAFSFWEGDTITPKDIRRVYKRLQQTFTVAKLQFRPDSLAQEKVAAQLKTL